MLYGCIVLGLTARYPDEALYIHPELSDYRGES